MFNYKKNIQMQINQIMKIIDDQDEKIKQIEQNYVKKPTIEITIEKYKTETIKQLQKDGWKITNKSTLAYAMGIVCLKKELEK